MSNFVDMLWKDKLKHMFNDIKGLNLLLGLNSKTNMLNY